MKKNEKYIEASEVLASREACLVDGSHGCGGRCYSLNAPHYSYNGGPHTPLARLQEEAAGGDKTAAEAVLLLLADEAAEAARSKDKG